MGACSSDNRVHVLEQKNDSISDDIRIIKGNINELYKNKSIDEHNRNMREMKKVITELDVLRVDEYRKIAHLETVLTRQIQHLSTLKHSIEEFEKGYVQVSKPIKLFIEDEVFHVLPDIVKYIQYFSILVNTEIGVTMENDAYVLNLPKRFVKLIIDNIKLMHYSSAGLSDTVYIPLDNLPTIEDVNAFINSWKFLLCQPLLKINSLHTERIKQMKPTFYLDNWDLFYHTEDITEFDNMIEGCRISFKQLYKFMSENIGATVGVSYNYTRSHNIYGCRKKGTLKMQNYCTALANGKIRLHHYNIEKIFRTSGPWMAGEFDEFVDEHSLDYFLKPVISDTVIEIELNSFELKLGKNIHLLFN